MKKKKKPTTSTITLQWLLLTFALCCRYSFPFIMSNCNLYFSLCLYMINQLSTRCPVSQHFSKDRRTSDYIRPSVPSHLKIIQFLPPLAPRAQSTVVNNVARRTYSNSVKTILTFTNLPFTHFAVLHRSDSISRPHHQSDLDPH